AICKTTTVDAAPLTIPDISPITSLQKLANLSSFRLMITASFAPFTFSAAIACKGASSAAVEAIPSISNIIPITTMSSTIIKPTNHATSLKTNDEMTEKIAASTNVITAIVKLNLIDFLKYGFMADSVYSL